jgi:hypothetical protein
MMSATELYTVEQILDAIDQGDVDTLKAACQVEIRERGRGRGRHDSESCNHIHARIHARMAEVK